MNTFLEYKKETLPAGEDFVDFLNKQAQDGWKFEGEVKSQDSQPQLLLDSVNITSSSEGSLKLYTHSPSSEKTYLFSRKKSRII